MIIDLTLKEEPANRLPAVPIHESIHNHYLVSLEDGRRFRSLRRHLMSSYGLTPAMYRSKWGLPRDYPMVAPSFAAERSELSKATYSRNRRHESSTEVEDAMMTLPSMDVEMAANLLLAMGNEKRMLVLDIISREETSVGRLAVMANITLSSLSQHLTKLRNFKLVQTRRDAQTIYYRSESEEVRKLLATVYEIYDVALPVYQSKGAWC
ncbi:metalloregulator ArsR/SmtB family transcription factor [Neorhizobium sp. DAR64872/K0K18]|uniref:metalloregulator ArsR/SmtB family transcription factor n=1 Tax=Neorhizobium sp. DAR64872/K0K18 TaxID=3421958 RepID=UPI003D26C623